VIKNNAVAIYIYDYSWSLSEQITGKVEFTKIPISNESVIITT